MKRLTTEEFIERGRNKHGDKYLYDKVVYVKSNQKVIITCPKHGDFSQKPNDHITGYGCPECGGTKKCTKERFIKRSKELWGDERFDYSRCEYCGIDNEVTLLCKKHNIEFNQTPYNHLKGKVSCRLCYEEEYNKKPNGYWSYEVCYEVAKKYSLLSDFQNNCSSCYDISLRKSYIEKFTWLERYYESSVDILIQRKHLIYMYVFTEFNSVYIGLTLNLDKRHKGHKKSGSVYDFCQENDTKLTKPIILENGLTIQEAKERECYWIDYYRNLGYTLINKVNGGSVGTISLKRLVNCK